MGGTWTAPERVNLGLSSVVSGDLLVDQQDTVHVLWPEGAPNSALYTRRYE